MWQMTQLLLIANRTYLHYRYCKINIPSAAPLFLAEIQNIEVNQLGLHRSFTTLWSHSQKKYLQKTLQRRSKSVIKGLSMACMLNLLCLLFCYLTLCSCFSKLYIDTTNICKISPELRKIKNCLLWSVRSSCSHSSRAALTIEVLLLAIVPRSPLPTEKNQKSWFCEFDLIILDWQLVSC